MSSGKSFFRKLYKVHVYAGLFVTVHFLIFAATGLPLLFKSEIQGSHETTEQKVIAASQLAGLYETALNQAQLAHPTDLPLAMFPADENENLLNMRLGIDGATKLRGSRRLAFDLTTGREALKQEAKSSDVFEWMLILHRELFLGSSGKLYIGLVGLVYVFMLMSGFFIYGNFMRNRSFADIRKSGIPKLVDLHKFVGVTTFAWGLIVGLSGVFLAFNGVLIKLFQYQILKHLTARYQGVATGARESLAPFARVIETALSAKPGSVISYVSFPGTEFGIPGHYLVLINGTEALTKRISELVVIGAQNADLKEIVELPLYLKIVLLSEPLHFGDYGGLFLKVVWAVFTLCSLAVALFGAASFFMKRRQRRQSAQVATDMMKPARNQASETGTPRSSSARKTSSKRARYLVPILLALLTGYGVVASLLLGEAKAYLASFVLLIPLAVVFLLWRKRDV